MSNNDKLDRILRSTSVMDKMARLKERALMDSEVRREYDEMMDSIFEKHEQLANLNKKISVVESIYTALMYSYSPMPVKYKLMERLRESLKAARIQQETIEGRY